MSPSIYNGTLQWDATTFSVISTNVNTTFNACLPNCSDLLVNWTSPTNGQVFSGLAAVPFAATATGTANIASVQFFVNDTLVGTDNTSPYTYTWTPPNYTSYVLKVVATDVLGASSFKQISITVNDPTVISISAQVNVTSDDAEENVATGSMDLNSSDLELAVDITTPQQVGIRFTNLNLPPGANITNAYIQFAADELNSATATLTVKGQNLGNPSTFTSTNANISSRAKTTASVAWSPVAWTVAQEATVKQRTPNLKTIVQEIVNRPDWAANNAMAFFVTGTGTRTTECFDGSPAEAPILKVFYSLSPPPVAAFSVSETMATPGSSVQFSSNSSGSNLVHQWTFEGGSPATSTATNPAVTYSSLGTFNVTLTVSNNGGSNTMVKTDYIVIDPFCFATGSTTTGNEYIINVLSGSINKTSGKSRYSGFTDLTTTVFKNNSYPIKVTLQTSSATDHIYVWADWNNNKVLESNESIPMSALNGANESTGTISVPATSVLGNVRLRVRNIHGTAGAQPCGDYEGEVEDYTLTVTELVAPNAPTVLQSLNITNNSATMRWHTSAGATGYDLQFRIPGGNWSVFQATDTSFNATGLSAGTNYEWQVRAFNTAGTSTYANLAFFTTCQTNCNDLAVAWTNPTEGQVFNNLNPINFAATASGDGSITQVAFFVNNVSVGVDNDAPYALTWTPPAFANYVIKAVATDNLNNTTAKQIGIAVQNSTSITVTSQITAGSDDAEQQVSNGVMYLTSTDLELTFDGTVQQQVGMRFKNLNIPPGATITNAYIQFTVDETSTSTAGLTIFGENLANPGTFTSTTSNISSRVKTTASVSWTPAGWMVVNEAGANQQTPNLSSIVQAIVSRPDWAANNAMVFITTGSGTRTAYAYEGSTVKVPKLFVTYNTNGAPIANFTANATAVSPGGNVQFTSTSTGLGLSHQWTFENGVPATSTAATPSVTYNTPGIHDVTLLVSNASGSNTLVKTDFITVGYCNGTGKAGTGGDYITNVMVGSIGNTSVQTSYSNFSNVVSNVVKNNAYPITVTLNYSFPLDYVYAWVDWNNNFVFENDELISMSALNASHQSTGTLNVPVSAVNGNVRLRIRNIYGNDGPLPCGDYWGEVEDYTLNVLGTTPPAAPTSLTTTSITSNSATLTWTASAGALGYQGQIRLFNGAWTAFNTVTTNFATTNLDAGASYEWRVRAYNTTDTSAYAAIVAFTTPLTGVTYCASSGNNATYEWIAEVKVGTFINSSGAAGYSNFTSSTITMQAGNNYALNLKPGFSGSSYNEYWRVWVDYNGDGSFGADELLFDPGSTSNVLLSATVAIPANVTPKTTRMRVSMKYNGAPTACSIFSYGEVEDYTVNITAPVVNPPAAPSGLSETAIAVSSVTLNWTASSGATSYTIQVRTPSGAWSTFTSTTNVLNATGLTANTIYEWQVKANNAAGSSVFSALATFTTLTFTAYCASEGDNATYEWISKVDVGSFTNASGAAGYSDFTAQTIVMEVGKSYNLTLTPGFSGSSYYEYWKIWIDLNGDGVFSASELLFDPSATSKTAINGTLTIPTGTTLRTTRMRVTMKYNNAANACEAFDYGEVEDYTVNIVAAQTIPYCAATTESILTYYYIKEVVFGGIDKTSTLGNTTTGYSDYTNLSTTAMTGVTYPIEVHFAPGWSGNSAKVYIDWNDNGDFNDANEQVLSGSGATSPYTAMVTVPTNAVLGTTRMRVRLAHYANVVPCGSLHYGETEDYTVQVALMAAASDDREEKRVENNSAENSLEGVVKIFPNPTSGRFTLSYLGDGPATAALLGLHGQLVRDFQIIPGQQEVFVEGLLPGLYFLRVKTQEGQFVEKLLIR
jgi:PKD repeat protein